MVDKRLTKLAQVLTGYCMDLKKGELFYVEARDLSHPLIREVYREALLRGANPFAITHIDGLKEIMYKYGTEEQIAFPNPVERILYEKADAFLTIWGDYNNKALTNINPEKLRIASAGRKESRKIYMERMNSGQMKWCGTQFPTHAAAMDADMSLEEYEDFVFHAGHLDCEDPIAEWKKISALQQKYVDYLNTKSKLEVRGRDIHLTLDMTGRKWVNCDGKVNFPDGEVFTSPVENSMNGQIRYSFPAIYMGKEVEDICLTFKDGKVVEATAKKGEAFLKEILKTDEGASLVGEFAIGTNYDIQKFTKNILFDEKLGGTIHIAVGHSVGETGGQNVSAIHWDMIADMKEDSEILADGEVFYRNGKFLI